MEGYMLDAEYKEQWYESWRGILMISVTIKIVNINYETTIRQIFPAIKEKLRSLESKNMVIRLFQKLDDAALPVLLEIMERLPQDTKDELLAICLNTYSSKVCEKLNEELTKHPYGKFLDVNRISIMREQESLYLWIGQVQVDYKGLVKEKITGSLGGIVSLLAPDRLEKMALALLWTADSKKKILGLAQSSLDKYGLVMELADIQMLQDKEAYMDAVDAGANLELTIEMTEDMLDALAGYLKEKT